MATDFMKMPPEILVDLINLTNGTSLRTADISYGPVTTQVSGNRNTGVTISATPGSIYQGTRDLTYNRVSFAQVIGDRNRVFERGEAMFVSHLIPKINIAYALNLQPEDYMNDPLPLPDGGAYTNNKPFTLRARPGSYVWVGQVELTLRGNKIPLNALWPVNVLDGFRLDVDTLWSSNILNGFYLKSDAPPATASVLTRSISN